jgi:FkbM family methyltransferase|tara:strand:+ start:598 stop:1212 length:615 start_codon:yes stop_codon:yes gene_type:complete
LSNFGFISIGSHTGYWLEEELKKFSDKKVILIEPVEYNLSELKERVKNYTNIIIEKVAISDKDETLPFYFIKRSSIEKLNKHWASGIGSFDKNHILNHRSKRFQVTDDDIETTSVECLSFNSLKKKHSITSIDKLMLDVEGAEYKILKSIDLKETLIKNIMFEKKHFDGIFNEGIKLQEIKDILISNGYQLLEIDKENILAKKE